VGGTAKRRERRPRTADRAPLPDAPPPFPLPFPRRKTHGRPLGRDSASFLAPTSRAGFPGRPSGASPRDHPLAFTALELHPALLKGVRDLGFARPTPIQTEAIPHALAARDLLACAAPGRGKTAASLLPLLHRPPDRPRGTTRALVLAPTRELALQILDDLQGLARHTRLRAAAVHGGVGMKPQEEALRSGVDVIVATPGRLLDHFQQGYAPLSGLE